PHGPSHDLSVRLVELADLQRKNRTRGVYFNVPGSGRPRAAAGAFAFARSWLARKPQNITAIPTNSPMYRAQESPKRAREPPAAMITAPIPIQRLNSRRERQKEYAAIPIKATLPGMVKSGE